MNAKNIYDAFVEIERLKKLVERYHKELKRKDTLIEALRKEIDKLIIQQHIETEANKYNISQQILWNKWKGNYKDENKS